MPFNDEARNFDDSLQLIYSGVESLPAPQLTSLFSFLLPLHILTKPCQHPRNFFFLYLQEGGGRGLFLLWPPNTSIHAIIFNRFKTDIPHKNFIGSTIQVLFYLVAFSSLKAFFHWDPTCSRNAIPLKIHTSISWQGFPYCFSSSYMCTFPHKPALFTRCVLLWVLC